jgi:hypothetical protein
MKKILFLLLISFNTFSQSEYKLYTAMTTHIIKYVQFPKTNTTFVIAIIDNDELYQIMKLIHDKSFNNQKIEVIFKTNIDNIYSNVIFVSSNKHLKNQILQKNAKENNILIISSNPEGTKYGSVINFITVDDKIRFEISTKNSEQYGLKISSDLMKIGIIKD